MNSNSFIPYFFDLRIAGNSVRDILIVISILLVLAALRRFFSVVLSRFLFTLIRKKAQSSAIQTFVTLLAKPLEWILVLMVAYLAVTQLKVPESWNLSPVSEPGLLLFIKKSYEVGLICSFAFLVVRLIDFFALEILNRTEASDKGLLDRQILPFVKELLKIFVLIIAFFFGLGFVFELNVANLVAGLGLGGLAVALAGKETLENLFASFTIFLDKPFVVGDQITVNGITGTVEKVGFRSTRIRTLQRSFVTLPNKSLVDNALDNLTLRTHQRADFLLTLVHGTSMEKLETAMQEMRSMLQSHPRNLEEILVRFKEFGENGLVIRVLFFLKSSDFDDFMEVREQINFLIFEILQKQDCHLAYPTRTLHLKQNDPA